MLDLLKVETWFC